MKKTGLLDVIAEQHRTYISNLRLLPELKWASLGIYTACRTRKNTP